MPIKFWHSTGEVAELGTICFMRGKALVANAHLLLREFDARIGVVSCAFGGRTYLHLFPVAHHTYIGILGQQTGKRRRSGTGKAKADQRCDDFLIPYLRVPGIPVLDRQPLLQEVEYRHLEHRRSHLGGARLRVGRMNQTLQSLTEAFVAEVPQSRFAACAFQQRIYSCSLITPRSIDDRAQLRRGGALDHAEGRHAVEGIAHAALLVVEAVHRLISQMESTQFRDALNAASHRERFPTRPRHRRRAP